MVTLGAKDATPAELARHRPYSSSRLVATARRQPDASQDSWPRRGARRKGRGAVPGPTLAAATEPWCRARDAVSCRSWITHHYDKHAVPWLG
jgi:hypothetical protein